MTIKELSDRIKECINIRSQMNDLGLSELFSMKEYYNIMNYLKNKKLVLKTKKKLTRLDFYR